MKTIKELDKWIEDKKADAYDVGYCGALQDVLGLIDELDVDVNTHDDLYADGNRFNPDCNQSFGKILEELKKRINGEE